MASKNNDIELTNLDKSGSEEIEAPELRLASEEQVSAYDNESKDRSDQDIESEHSEQEPFLPSSHDHPNEIEMRPLNRRNRNTNEDSNHPDQETRSLLETTNIDEIVRVEDTSVAEENAGVSTDNVNRVQDRNRFSRIGKYLSTENPYVRGFKPTPIKIFYLIILVFFLFLSVFLPMCITSIQYDRIALVRNTWTGYVNENNVYSAGVHFLLPWKQFMTFDSTVRNIQIDNMRIFTTDKLEVKCSFRVYYFIDKTSVGYLYRNFGLDFTPLIRKVVVSELLNAGQVFSIEDFRTKRTLIKSYLKDILAKKLKNDYKINIFEFYIHSFEFTEEINNLNLKRMINDLLNEKAVYERQTALTQKETSLQVQKILNEAKLVLTMAEAKAYNDTLKKEQINAYNKLEVTHVNSLNNSLSQLGFYQADKTVVNKHFTSKRILSFCYVSSLINNNNLVFFPTTTSDDLFNRNFVQQL